MSVEATVGSKKMVLLEERPIVEFISTCRACGGALEAIGGFGNQCVIDFPDPKTPTPMLRAPLDLYLCEECCLVQLGATVNPDRLFKKFWYRSGINPQMKKALMDVVTKTLKVIGGLYPGDAVADIGSNDGTLLNFFKTPNLIDHLSSKIHTVGFEPCEEMVQIAEAGQTSEVIFNSYFQRGPKVDALLQKWHSTGFKIIFALAMFYDLDEPGRFVADVYDLLHHDGVFVIQMNYLKAMLKNNAFDNISHEHLCYYSLKSLQRLLSRVGLRILDAEENAVNGGSIRVYVGIEGSDLRPPFGGMLRVENLITEEESFDIRQQLRDFFVMQHHISKALSVFIRTVSGTGKKVYVYGASTRGTTLLQTLDADVWPLLLGAAERDERKYGRCMVGTRTPIVSEDEARLKADFFLILPWGFLPSMLEREKAWMERGGQFIVPLPVPRVIGVDGERSLL